MLGNARVSLISACARFVAGLFPQSHSCPLSAKGSHSQTLDGNTASAWSRGADFLQRLECSATTSALFRIA